jgi:hypothetical protein
MTRLAFITLLLLIGTVAVGPLMKGRPLFSSVSVNTAAVKVAGITILAMSHAMGVALHPFLAPPKESFLAHFMSFKLWLVVALAIGQCLTEYGYNPGYPVLPSTSLLTAFMVPYIIFTAYLLLFSALIRKGYSRQLANLAMVAVLVAVDTHPWHPNPIIIGISITAYGFKWVYAIHLLAIAIAVVTMKILNAYLAPPPSPPSGVSIGAFQRLMGALKGSCAQIAKSHR